MPLALGHDRGAPLERGSPPAHVVLYRTVLVLEELQQAELVPAPLRDQPVDLPQPALIVLLEHLSHLRRDLFDAQFRPHILPIQLTHQLKLPTRVLSTLPVQIQRF